MTVRTALQKSKNMVTIRVLQSIGTSYAQEWSGHFGLDADKQPPYLPMALGAGSVTPLQMAVAYGVFANGGHRVNPSLVSKVVERGDKVLFEAQPPVLDESTRAIPERFTREMPSRGRWRTPFNDTYINYSRDGLPNHFTITALVDRILAVTEQAILANGGRRGHEDGALVYAINPAAAAVLPTATAATPPAPPPVPSASPPPIDR